MKTKLQAIISFIILYFFINNSFAFNNNPEDLPKTDSIVTEVVVPKTIVKQKDAAYESKAITIIQLYWSDEFNMKEARQVLEDEGYTITGWKEEAPSVSDLKIALEKSNQLWIISDATQKLTPAHLKVIKDFFNAGHGVYLLGDNADYYMDANYIGKALVGATLIGEYDGEQKITFPKKVNQNITQNNNQSKQNNNQGQNRNNNGQGRNGQGQSRNNQNNYQNGNNYNTQKIQAGRLLKHDITDSLEHLYEGITVSGVDSTIKDITPVVIGSDNEILIGTYEKNDKRLVLDGGFTRLYNSWDNETSKFVENIVLWLANSERFDTEITTNKITETVIDLGLIDFQIVTESQATPE